MLKIYLVIEKKMGVEDSYSVDRQLSPSTLATLRGILVSSLSRENLGVDDLPIIRKRKVTFQEESYINGEYFYFTPCTFS